MSDGSILYIPIQINGDGTTAPTNLKDRELYVLDNGTLYVGRKNADGSVKAVEVAGRVIDKATITNPTLSGTITLDKNLSPDGERRTLFFVDDQKFELPGDVDNETLINALNTFIQRVEDLTQSGGAASGVVNTILEADVESEKSDN